ncbi:MAG: hypothetical protein AB2A00_18345 [Myxococcota bacterium]
MRELVRPVAPDEVVYVVSFPSNGTALPPRMAEVFLRHSDDLELVEAVALAGALGAGKTLVSQAKPGVARLVLYAADNTNALLPGDWVAVRFRKVVSGPARAELAYDRTSFAPATVIPGPQTLTLHELGEVTP